MIVVVEDAVFTSSRTEHLFLSALLKLGFEGRHRIRTDPLRSATSADDPPGVTAWLQQQSPAIREEAELALQDGIEGVVKGFPMDSRLRVVDAAQPDWSADPPRLPLAEALSLLERSLELMVEDEENDGAFLRAVAPQKLRNTLSECLTAGWVRLTHGGGLARMLPRLEKKRTTGQLLRLWVLFDSDAREPGQPSKESQAVCDVCEGNGIAFYQLQRRAAENYLPLEAVSEWVDRRPSNVRKRLKETYSTFQQMSRAQRHHYNMRQGFHKDEKDQRGVAKLYDNLVHRPELQTGFGRDIRDLFKQDKVRLREEWLVNDGQQQETARMIMSILRRL